MKRADYKILANGNDITRIIRDRFVSMSIRDAAGFNSDSVSITLDNRDGKIQFPATGAELDVHIGYVNALVFKGTYQVTELEEPLDDDILMIHGTAAKMKSSLKAPRDVIYDDITLGELVEQVAQDNGYRAAVSDELASIHYEHIDQVGESDMNLLTRLARERKAFFKPVADRLVIVPKAESRTVTGKNIPPITLSDRENSTGRVVIQERTDFESVVAYWFSEEQQEKIPETAGSGEPQFVIRRKFKDAESALKAAEAKLGELQRGQKTLDITRPLDPSIVPEAPLILKNHKPSANGEWLVEQVEHTYQSNTVATTSASAVTP
ncbi:contractile injection system protein, VgrG/Pvc8 family [Endozoicomonas montiporae]|uniref:contractile injection system protein, VgrG/Pvc8 family n=1 Tax=Endozoicomonas montiporae TaxID=1027273 RepID=UPI001F1810C2|nr:contractile injection system protein, VgrG/Pvc8 family [Endozoicomonas montiporae]